MNSENRKRRSTSVRGSKRLKLSDKKSDGGDDENGIQENQCSITNLPVECIQKIISYLPGRQWPRLELVNRKFRSGVLASWRCSKEVHLIEYSDKTLFGRYRNAKKQSLLSILRLLQIRSPTVQTIDGFESFSFKLDSDIMVEMAKFRVLKTVTFSDCELFVSDLATFLANSRSRSVLEELRITSSVLRYGQRPKDEKAIRQALIDIEGRPGLRLKTFYYTPKNRCYPENLLSALDVSQLETLSVTIKDATASVGVAGLLGRCTQLKELAIDMDSALDPPVEPIFNALKSLRSPNLRKLEFDTDPFEFCEEFCEALKELAQRCPKMEVLNLRGDNDDEILDVIGECFSNLKELSIDLRGVSKEAFTGLIIRMGQLKKLGLHFVYGNTGCRIMKDAILAMAMNTDNLVSLHLDMPPALTENAMSKLEQMKGKELSVKFQLVKKEFVTICQRLGPIMVSADFGETRISDQLLAAAIGNKKMSQLRRISLENTRITDLSLHAIGDSCPLLKELNIEGCKGITANGIRSMIEKCKKLTRLKVYRKTPGLRDLIRSAPVNIET